MFLSDLFLVRRRWRLFRCPPRPPRARHVGDSSLTNCYFLAIYRSLIDGTIDSRGIWSKCRPNRRAAILPNSPHRLEIDLGRRLANQPEEIGELQIPDPGIGAEPQQVAVAGNDKPRAGGHGAFKHAVVIRVGINDIEPLPRLDTHGAARKQRDRVPDLLVGPGDFARRVRLSSSGKASEIASRNRPASAPGRNRLGRPAKISPEM